MKKIHNFKSFNEQKEEELNEGFKDWVLGSLIALSSFAASGQDMDKAVKADNGHTYQISTKGNSDRSIVSGFIKYQKQIVQQKGTITKVKNGKYITIKGQGFSGGVSPGSGYSKGNVFITFGSEKDPTAQINVSLKDDGAISIMFGEGHHAHYASTGLGLRVSNSQTLSQTELRKGDPGYKEALDLLELCGVSTGMLR
jgi:hypothetical protein